MKAKINTGITAEGGPEEHGDGDGAAAKIKGNECSGAEGVGCMRGDEAIETAALVAHEVHKTFEGGFVGGAEAVEEGLAEAARETVGDEDDECQTGDEQEHLTPGAVSQEDVEEDEDEGEPCGGGGDGDHHAVQPGGIAAVEGEEELLIGMNDLVEQGGIA